MTTFIYRGPFSGVTLPDGREVLLHDGKTVDLPGDNPWVADLLYLGHLEPVATPLVVLSTPTPAPPDFEPTKNKKGGA